MAQEAGKVRASQNCKYYKLEYLADGLKRTVPDIEEGISSDVVV